MSRYDCPGADKLSPWHQQLLLGSVIVGGLVFVLPDPVKAPRDICWSTLHLLECGFRYLLFGTSIPSIGPQFPWMEGRSTEGRQGRREGRKEGRKEARDGVHFVGPASSTVDNSISQGIMGSHVVPCWACPVSLLGSIACCSKGNRCQPLHKMHKTHINQ